MFRTAYIGSWVVVVTCVLFYGIRLGGGRDSLGFIGAVGLAGLGVLALGWYGIVTHPQHPAELEPEQQRQILAEVRNDLWWVLLSMNSFVPGVWIGGVARNPTLITLCYALTFLGVRGIFRLVDPGPHSDPVRRPLPVESLLYNATLLLLGAIVGSSARLLLHP